MEIKHFIEAKMKMEIEQDEKPILIVKKFFDHCSHSNENDSKKSSRFVSDEEKISHIRQEKQELMIQIEECKKKIGEIHTVSEIKIEMDAIKLQNKRLLTEIYKLLP